MRDTEITSHVNKVVESVWISSNKERLAFVFTDGTQLVFHADGDCCAHCWIEHADNLGFKGTLLSVDTAGVTEMPKGEDRYNVVDQEFITFKTDSGRLTIDLRTSHNGYYGGHLDVVDQVMADYEDTTWTQVE